MRRRKDENKKIKKGIKGITIVALVITIVLLLILAGVSINLVIGNNGITTKSQEAKIMNILSGYKEELEMYKTSKSIENNEFNAKTLTAGKDSLAYIGQKDSETGTIKDIIHSISNEYLEKLEIIKGELLINTKNKAEIKIAQSLGIQVNPYDIVNGELISSDGNLFLVDETGTLVVPSSVTAIGQGAFSQVEGLKTIIIPSTVKEIKQDAFAGNKTLEQVIFKTDIVNGIEQGTEIIGQSAFKDCSNLTTIKIPNTVREIGSACFFGCTSLKNVTLSNNMTNIPGYMFYHCSSLTNISIPEGTKIMYQESFCACNSLENIYIPKSVEQILGAFRECTNLERIEVDSQNSNFRWENGILFNKDKTEMIFISKSAISGSTFTVPDTVEKLTSGLINNYTQIQKVVIPVNITNIDFNFFQKNITEINIDVDNPNYISQDGKIYNKDKTILYLHYLDTENVTLEEGIEKIETHAFRLCKKLKKLTLPDSLKGIESHAIYGNIDNLIIGKNVDNLAPLACYNARINNLTIDSNNEYYMAENNVIYNKEKTTLIAVLNLGTVTEFTIPYGVQEIGNYAFHNQYNMKSVTIPETVTRINASFNYCTSLEKIEIPSNVERIHTGCFSNSNSLKQIIIDKKAGSIEGSPWSCIYGDRAVIWKK